MTAEPQIVHNAAESRYELHLGGEVAAFAEYRPAGDAVMLSHTETREGYEGRGLASRLIGEVLDTLKAEGRGVLPMCPFVAGYMREHREYADLVQPAQRAVFGL
ncbi:GNAT family N-acetyltransferase [Deinococcus hohokamensis]|uniref:GNAT family N-acetyltransferase n=1 Tax=Deinococcus hohokamensis TaxID=309883 RepID=A0ABV9IAP3_9DEIO